MAGLLIPRFGRFKITFMDKKQELERFEGRLKAISAESSELKVKIKALKDSIREDELGLKIGDKVAYMARSTMMKPARPAIGILRGFAAYESSPIVQVFKVDGTLGSKHDTLYGDEAKSLRKIGGSHE